MRLKKPKFWDYKEMSLWSILLYPLSIIYLILIWLSRIPSIFKAYKNPFPIICVGNIYVGGTGKTPLAAEIFNILKSKKKNPSFIKKHYDYLLDEIKMLQEIGNTYYAKNRSTAIGLSLLNGNNVAILDDGFQDFSIKKDLNILCFNSKQLIGNGMMIPAGPLREEIGAIKRSHIILINGDKNEMFEKKILSISNKVKIFYSKYVPTNINEFKEKKLIAFAGIGNPDNFFSLLEENNLRIEKKIAFPDHYQFNKSDIQKLLNESLANNLDLITTEKDYFRIKKYAIKEIKYIKLKLEIFQKNEFLNQIKNFL